LLKDMGWHSHRCSAVSDPRFREVVLQAAESRLQELFPLFPLVGDWYTGAHRLDETGKALKCIIAAAERSWHEPAAICLYSRRYSRRTVDRTARSHRTR